jgi:hypothetical protein
MLSLNMSYNIIFLLFQTARTENSQAYQPTCARRTASFPLQAMMYFLRFWHNVGVIKQIKWSRSSSVGTATGYWLDGRG